jgi:uncharacterized Zn finger protein
MAASSSLRLVLTASHVRQLASDRSYARGETYVADGHVLSLVESRDTLTATVRGTSDYRVRLTAADDTLAYRCSCPVGADGKFCKHAVAVALAWLAADNPKKSRSPGAAKAASATPVVHLDDLRPWLLEQRPAMLTDLLLETAARDDRLREQLLRAAARATSKGPDFTAYRKSIDRATRTGGFIDYHSAGGFAENAREAVMPLHELLAEDRAHARAVIELAEHALERVEAALSEADDSNGEISDVLSELQDLHFAACEAARPDPEALAARLFAWEMRSDWDTFYHAVETYADILGPTGLAAYRRLAEAAWKSLPALTARAGERATYEGKRFRLTSIMEALASTTGDLEALVAIKAKDLSHAYHYLQIAELYHNANQPDAALDWAERGLKAFPQDTDARLLGFVADEYHLRRRHDDALALIWRLFDARPSLENFQLLQKHAGRAGTEAWPAWRERALAYLRKPPKGPNHHSDRFAPLFADFHRSILVQIFLGEKNADDAWREAHAGNIADQLWLELASAREATHPADVLPIYLRLAENHIALTQKAGYQEAVRLLRKAKKLFLALDRGADWEAALERLRAAHKAKRNFLALAAGL